MVAPDDGDDQKHRAGDRRNDSVMVMMRMILIMTMVGIHGPTVITSTQTPSVSQSIHGPTPGGQPLRTDPPAVQNLASSSSHVQKHKFSSIFTHHSMVSAGQAM